MQVYHPEEYTATRPWGAIDLERIDDATVRLHWADTPYIWHVNDGPEVFAVLDGIVDMYVRRLGSEQCYRLEKGDVFHAVAGDEHKAVPIGQARILVIERAGSV
jgi:mannose-6-phosphate isomerase-like protein (cupin superfamily)